MKRFLTNDLLVLEKHLVSLMEGARTSSHLFSKKNPLAYFVGTTVAQEIQVASDRVLSLKNSDWKSFITEGETLGIADWVEANGKSSFEQGKDYYIYLYDDGSNGKLVISENATKPTGTDYTASNTRKMGGFHVGTIRVVDENGVPGYGDPLSTGFKPLGQDAGSTGSGASSTWVNQVAHKQIVPASVWDLKHRPKCSPEGMVDLGNGVWADIYQASQAENITLEFNETGTWGTDYNAPGFVKSGKLQSKYGCIPLTGSEHLTALQFVELAQKSGKRLPNYKEWCQAAYGSPDGSDGSNDNGWTKTTNTARCYTGCSVDPSTGNFATDTGVRVKPYAVSAKGVVDCVGNVYEYTTNDNYGQDGDSGWAWQTKNKLGRGQFFGNGQYSFKTIICGGAWNRGALCSARAASLGSIPFSVSVLDGVRLFSDSL